MIYWPHWRMLLLRCPSCGRGSYLCMPDSWTEGNVHPDPHWGTSSAILYSYVWCAGTGVVSLGCTGGAAQDLQVSSTPTTSGLVVCRVCAGCVVCVSSTHGTVDMHLLFYEAPHLRNFILLLSQSWFLIQMKVVPDETCHDLSIKQFMLKKQKWHTDKFGIRSQNVVGISVVINNSQNVVGISVVARLVCLFSKYVTGVPPMFH